MRHKKTHAYLKRRKAVWLLFVAYVAILSAIVVFFLTPQAVPQGIEPVTIEPIVADPTAEPSDIVKVLYQRGYIQSTLAMRLLSGLDSMFGNIRSGAYTLSRGMSLWEVYGALANPTSRWVSIPPGLRREEVAHLLDSTLIWDSGDSDKFINLHERFGRDALEGYYFPGKYLLAINDSGAEVGSLMIRRFDEKVGPRLAMTAGSAINLDTIVIIASIIQREAAGPEDMRLISGVIWNRIFNGMNLQMDATLQYAKGNEVHGWWPRVHPDDKYIESPFNTYLHEGLPPTPISNPGLSAINAAYRPLRTYCLFYFHDKKGSIHCSRTNEEHEKKIRIYYGPAQKK